MRPAYARVGYDVNMPAIALLLALQDAAGWTLEKEVVADERFVKQTSAKLGVTIEAALNRYYKRAGVDAQVNLVTCADEDEARKLEVKLGERAVRRGKVVYEFVGSTLIGRRLRFDMGLSADTAAEYEVTIKLACVEKHDYMTANRVTNLLMAGQDVADLTKDWTFGRSVRLFGEWTCAPEPSARADEGGVTRYTFEKPPVDRVPYVEAKATIRVRDRYAPAGKAVDGLTKATAFWPVDDCRELAAKIVGDAKTDAAKLDAIIAWVSAEIRYGGKVVGSRWGVAKVLEQKQGHCWDKSDILVTVARAAGLPARQVAGWLHKSEGHVWCEVAVDGAWLPVDATCPWPGVSDDYVPFFRTDDGAMPVVYLTKPELKRR
jgi:hypothetical protein